MTAVGFGVAHFGVDIIGTVDGGILTIVLIQIQAILTDLHQVAVIGNSAVGVGDVRNGQGRGRVDEGLTIGRVFGKDQIFGLAVDLNGEIVGTVGGEGTYAIGEQGVWFQSGILAAVRAEIS